MPLRPTDITAKREEIICAACAALAREFRLIDPLMFANFFHFAQSQQTYEEITAIVARNFPGGQMIFGCSGDALITWGAEPVVAVDLEFSAAEIFLFFRLIFTKTSERVEMHHIAFNLEETGEAPSAEANTERLRSALEAARQPA
jgi:hypothetical protein